eukprot:CAMPEP_0119106488 /NCGR_PEP_ID=MMETSP1180-20130426/4488_1 /TAXON_ID=3052 ORGANISM="Chlamydomonas cf sp, Strain CCMP681" /NCGR_SAMPLE_ID=MMETSP1180 /ASSEMBLY_ACC=CAM_ASM_000741 /LENGTH=143 /DNA_ID=CAMNT_0007091837 /DNA_START=88 /DNA_END=516 /DNA_ORIENTATION=-
MAASLELIYWAFPGRAETTRVLLTLGGVPFKDTHVAYLGPEWEALKPKTPYGQVPVLEVDGVTYAQSSAIERYAASLAGVYPTSPLEQLKVDQLVAFAGEFWEPLVPTLSIADAAEKAKAQDSVAAKLQPKFEKLTSIIKAAG